MPTNKPLANPQKKPIDPKKTQQTAPGKPLNQAAAWWRRPVGLITFFGIPIILLLLAGRAGFLVYQEIHREAPELIPQHKLSEFQKKKTTLAKARSLREKGRYVESVAVYDQYLERYPKSTAARQGRSAAMAQIERPAGSTTRGRSAPVAVAEQRKPEQEKTSMREKVRRIFRRRS
jgi:hypothetical protein